MLLLFVFIAGSSYGYAAWITGNPFLPLFNQVFHAAVLPPVQLDDGRWHAGFSVALPWSITFRTERYLECWNGGFGFSAVMLSGAWLLALLTRMRRAPVLAATAILLLPLLPMQYARYAFPGLVLLLPVLMVTLRDAVGPKPALAIASVLCVLNIAFQANASWSLHSSARKRLVISVADIEDVFRHFAPERALLADLRARDDGESIVFAIDPTAPVIAELAGRGRCVAWYDTALHKRWIAAEADVSGEEWSRLFNDTRARWLLLRPANASEALRNGLARAQAERIATQGEAELWLLPSASSPAESDAS
jgi:hypothetical protein